MSLDDRLTLLNLDYFTDSDEEVVIEEDAADGKVSLTLKVSRRCLALHKADKRSVGFLKNQSVADCIILELHNGEAVALHIFELKKSITVRSWKKTLSQFEGAFHNALGLLGILGLDFPENILFYSAFSRNRLDSAPTLRKTESGNPGVEDARNVMSWQKNRIDIAWVKNAPLKRVEWDWEVAGPHPFTLPEIRTAQESERLGGVVSPFPL